MSAKVDCESALSVNVAPAAKALGSLGAGAKTPLLNTDCVAAAVEPV